MSLIRRLSCRLIPAAIGVVLLAAAGGPARAAETVAEVTSKIAAFPAFSGVTVTSVVDHHGYYTAKVGSRNIDVTALAKKIGNATIWTVVVMPGANFSFGNIFREARHTPLGGAKIENALFMIAETRHTLKVRDFPAPVQVRLKKFTGNDTNRSVTLKAGINVLATIDLKTSGEVLKALHESLGGARRINVGGWFGPTAMQNHVKGQLSSSGTDLGNLSIGGEFPTFSPTAHSHISISSLSVTFKGDSRHNKITAAATASVVLTVGTAKHTIAGAAITLDSSPDVGKQYIAFDAAFTGTTPAVSAFPGIKITSVNFVGGVYRKSTGRHLWLGVSATATLNNTSITFTASVPSGSDASDAYVIRLAGSLKVKDLAPHADVGNTLKNLAVSEVIIAPSGVSATVTDGSTTIDLAMFETGSGSSKEWNLALSYAGKKFSDLISGTASTPLGQLTLDHAALIVSKNGVPSQRVDHMSAAAQPLFTAILGDAQHTLNLAAGVTLIAVLDPANTGTLKTVLRDVGVSSRKLTFIGTIGGFFGGTKSLDVAAPMPEFSLSSLPAFAKLPTSGLNPSMYVKYVNGAVDFGVSVSTTLHVTMNGATENFDTTLAIDVAATDITIGVTGSLDNDWASPFGIKALTLLGKHNASTGKGTSIAFDVASTGSATVTLTGQAKAGSKQIAVTASVTAEGGALDAAAFEGSINEIGLSDIAAVANDAIAAGGGTRIDMSALPAVTMKSVDVAFASPGSNAPSVGLHGAGTRFKGDLWVFSKKVSTLSADVDDTGFNLSGNVSGLGAIGPLTLNNPTVAAGGGTGTTPYFKFSGGLTLLNETETVDMFVSADHVSFSMTDDFGGAWQTKITASGSVNQSSPNFTVSGEFQGDFDTWLMNHIKSPLQGLHLASTATIDSSFQQAVTAATTNLDRARALAIKAQEKSLQATAAADNAASDAENRYNNCEGWVTHYRNKAAHYKHERDHTSWTEPLTIARYEVDMLEEDANMLAQEAKCIELYAVWQTLKATSEAAANLSRSAALAKDLNTNSIVARAALATANAEKLAATAAVNAVNAVKSDLNTLVRALTAGVSPSTFKVTQASFSNVSLSDLTGNAAMNVSVTVVVNGATYSDTISFTLGGNATTIATDFAAFALKIAKGVLRASKTAHPISAHTPEHDKQNTAVAVDRWNAKWVLLKNESYPNICITLADQGNNSTVFAARCDAYRQFGYHVWRIETGTPVSGVETIRLHSMNAADKNPHTNLCLKNESPNWAVRTCSETDGGQRFGVIRSNDPNASYTSFYITPVDWRWGGDGATYFQGTPATRCLSTGGPDHQNLRDTDCGAGGHNAWFIIPWNQVTVPTAATPVTTPDPHAPLTSLSLDPTPPAGTANAATSAPPDVTIVN